MALSNNQIKVLKHLEDGEYHTDVAKGMTMAQYADAMLVLRRYEMVLASINYGKVLGAQIEMKGQAYLDNLMDKNNVPISDKIPLSEMEIAVLEHLSDGNNHPEAPEGMMSYEYKMLCQRLKEKEMVELYFTKDGDIISINKDGLDALRISKERKSNRLTNLQATLLDLLSKNFDNMGIPNLQVYEPFNQYTITELYDEFIPLKENGLILFFGDDPRKNVEKPSYFKIQDEGRIALRKYKHANPETQTKATEIISDKTKDTLHDEVAYMFEYEEDVDTFLTLARKAQKPTEITTNVRKMVAAGRIKKDYCKGTLWKVLHDAGIYKRSDSNWNTQVKV